MRCEFNDPGQGADWDDTVWRFETRDGEVKVTNIENDRGPNPTQTVQNAGSFSSRIFAPSGALVAEIQLQQLPGASGTYTIASARADYGMNNLAHLFRRDSNKILMLDYTKLTASVVGPDALDIFSEKVAPRHRNQVNVLYADGHVVSHKLLDIDPTIPSQHDTLWLPTVN